MEKILALEDSKAPRALTHARKLYAPEYWVRRITATWDRL
jgi:hypothetical protein